MQSEGEIRLGVCGPGTMGADFIRTAHKFGCRITEIAYHRDCLPGIKRQIELPSHTGAWYGHNIDIDGSGLIIDDNPVLVHTASSPEDIQWQDVDIVLDSSGKHNNPGEALRHIKNNVPRLVVLSAPPKKEDCPTYVFGVNHRTFVPGESQVISNASCSTNALAELSNALDILFGLKRFNAVIGHASTPSNVTFDHIDDGIEGVGILNNYIEETTGASKTLAKVLPGMVGKLKDIYVKCYRGPWDNGSLIDFDFETRKAITQEKIRDGLANLCKEGDYKDVLSLDSRKISAVAHVRENEAAVVIPEHTIQVRGSGRYKYQGSLIGYFDNIHGYNCQTLRLIRYCAGLIL